MRRFSESLVWGWLRRVYEERRISHILTSLDHLGADTADRQKLLLELAAALDANDPYLNGHSRCLARLGGRYCAAHDRNGGSSRYRQARCVVRGVAQAGRVIGRRDRRNQVSRCRRRRDRLPPSAIPRSPRSWSLITDDSMALVTRRSSRAKMSRLRRESSLSLTHWTRSPPSGPMGRARHTRVRT